MMNFVKEEGKGILFINEQHSLFDEQKALLEECFQKVQVIKVPASGWNLEEMKGIYKKLIPTKATIVFASPIPYLLKVTSSTNTVAVFHNDNREKKELPNGKIISVVSSEGWRIV